MKKVLISLILLVPMLTGCANVDTLLTLNDDKSATVVTSVTYQGDLSAKDDLTALAISDSYGNFLDSLYKVDRVNSSKLSTITASKSVKDLSKMDLNLSSLGLVSNLPSKKFVEIKKSFLLTSFNIDCTYDVAANNKKYSASNISGDKTIKPEYFHKYADKKDIVAGDFNREFVDNMDDATKQAIVDFLNEVDQPETNSPVQSTEFTNSFSIQVPAFASYNNADSVSGNIYTWNIVGDEPINIKLQYVQYSGFAIAFIILLGVLFLVVLAGRILKHDAQKRIDNIENIV